ncbi:unnamed protein product [Parnassius mnemosyne]|uniref:Uncharacterized protein n=1 Tax=Parnassius mnemosyne TaxID=213953 RepID=A0AAV1L204_9NEOP
MENMKYRCCPCPAAVTNSGKSSLPLICLVPRDGKSIEHAVQKKPRSTSTFAPAKDFPLLDEEYIKKNFKLPPRALYLDPHRRPLITFPMTQEISNNFNMARKNKINQQILDGYLDPSEAIASPSVFPYGKTKKESEEETKEDEELIYILQLPDWEFKCPVHHHTVKTPRFIWHTCKKSKKESNGELKHGGGPLKKPKPWLLSRHTDFDLLSQW